MNEKVIYTGKMRILCIFILHHSRHIVCGHHFRCCWQACLMSALLADSSTEAFSLLWIYNFAITHLLFIRPPACSVITHRPTFPFRISLNLITHVLCLPVCQWGDGRSLLPWNVRSINKFQSTSLNSKCSMVTKSQQLLVRKKCTALTVSIKFTMCTFLETINWLDDKKLWLTD